MKLLISLHIVLFVFFAKYVASEDEAFDYTLDLDEERCCHYGESLVLSFSTAEGCASASAPDEIEDEYKNKCQTIAKNCCAEYYKKKEKCMHAMKYASEKRCRAQDGYVGKTCCEECIIGRLTGETKGEAACGEPPSPETHLGGDAVLRKIAYHTCCVAAARQPTTTEKVVPTITTEKVTTTPKPRERCKPDACEHRCDDESGKVVCSCHEGYRLQHDKWSCKDINECAEAVDDLCTADGTVCHNIAGAFKCVPLQKRDVSLSCAPGYMRNVEKRVCDDIDECNLPSPPCPMYLCKNTVGGYTCGNTPEKPFEEAVTEGPTAPAGPTATQPGQPSTRPKNDICPSEFRAGENDDCDDIDECTELLDDCQRLSQYCINTHGAYFCQDHGSRNCKIGFKADPASGKCEDINECDEPDTCQRLEICINQPGAYRCESKISTLPKLHPKNCQEGTRSVGGVCLDIDECVESTHLCDAYQNCINKFGGHECRCKQGYEMGSSGSCEDVDECALKLDDCGPETVCQNTPGQFYCRHAGYETVGPEDEFEYDEENTTSVEAPATSQKPAPKPTPERPRPTTSTSRPRPTTRPTTTSTQPTTTPSTTTPAPPPLPPRPTYSPYSPNYHTTPRRPYTNRPRSTEPSRQPATPKEPSYPDYSISDKPEPPRRDTPEYPRYDTTATSNRPSYPRPDNESSRRPENPATSESRSGRERPYHPRAETTESPRREGTGSSRWPKPYPPYNPTTVAVPPPDNPATIEKETDPEGTYSINTADIPNNTWTNVVGKPETPKEPEQQCPRGYEKNSAGDCNDIDECRWRRARCGPREACVNVPGSYRCSCMSGRRNPDGVCLSEHPAPTTTTEQVVVRPNTQRAQPNDCDKGYRFNSHEEGCVDINECLSSRRCGGGERCENFPGGYRCESSTPSRSYTPTQRPAPPPTRRPAPSGPRRPGPHSITVRVTYGQRGLHSRRPTLSRQHTGETVAHCPVGYELQTFDKCVDVDECARQISECGPEQECTNFYGGHSCACPDGYQLDGTKGCQDIDECQTNQFCSSNSKCLNTVGSFQCQCDPGFYNSDPRMCLDVNECAEGSPCDQHCANTWGSYRCYCDVGYRLGSDNSTCEDIDECAEWSSSGRRGVLCVGRCENVPGSYRCHCPSGYRMADDGRNCIDINECETRQAHCAHGAPGEVCQNTRGGYHCHTIRCPSGYQLEAKHKCSRVERSCAYDDEACFARPASYSYHFVTFAARMQLPRNGVDLFNMHGPQWTDATLEFSMRLMDVKPGPNVRAAEERCFSLAQSGSSCRLMLHCRLEGPQVAQLEIVMSLYAPGRRLAGAAAVRLIVIVSEYEF